MVGILGLVGCSSTAHAPAGGSTGGAGDISGSGGDTTQGAPRWDKHVAGLREAVVDKVDVLLTIDNSASMNDKQQLLAEALPYLIQRLPTPRCVRACAKADNCTPEQELEHIPTGDNADASGACPRGGSPDLPPIRDLHFAVISSSLGADGASGADSLCSSASDDDHAQLLGAVRGVSGTFQDSGFLAWTASGAGGTESDAQALAEDAAALVKSAGDSGCQLPATLEAWYRFLIDPEPPASVSLDASTRRTRVDAVDQTVLAQRAAFLRSDSLVLIGMLSDKNDCSVVDTGYGWMVASGDPMPLATSACATNPNDPCCQSCAETTAHAGCPAIASDSVCRAASRPVEKDAAGLRCWDQKRRFGVDLLYPTKRYVEALKSPTVERRSTLELVPNPLFAASSGRLPRDPGLVQLFGIVGVPWQDLADQASLGSTDSLSYLGSDQLEALGRWSLMLGDADASPPTLPADPFMIEDIAERSGMHPVTLDTPLAAGAEGADMNRINGREHESDGKELQYACRFPLAQPRACDAAVQDGGCDCSEGEAAARPSLCRAPSATESGTTQYHAKAYPSPRQLEVLRAQPAAVVASICPKTVAESSPSSGYLPAMDAVARLISRTLRPRCLATALPIDSIGAVNGCEVVTSYTKAAGECDCAAHGWREVSSSTVLPRARRALELSSGCSPGGALPCDQFCLCEVPQLEGADLMACQNQSAPPVASGYCYINGQDGEPQVGNPALVQWCSDSERRFIRVTGEPIAAENLSFVVCDSEIVP